MTEINTEIYDELGENWYEAQDNPVALLRAESRFRNPWVLSKIREKFKGGDLKLLDVGCGAGFLSNYMASNGLQVTGVDMSESSLKTAQHFDKTKTARYIFADAHSLPFNESEFDVVCAMDFLEHVERPELVVAQVSRVLKPGGVFFFYTFNRNWISRLVVIKGVEWFVKNTPPHLHVYEMFVKPKEMLDACRKNALLPGELQGMRPVISRAFFKMLRTGSVPPDFSFKFTSSTLISYLGYAYKA